MNGQRARHVYDFHQIKRSVSFAAILERYNILAALKPSGKSLVGACPVHGGTNKRQFVVDLQKGLWKCFGDCDRGGSTIELVSALERIEIREAAELIAQWFAIPSSGRREGQHSNRSTTMSGEKPAMKAFVVEDREEGSDDKPFWTRVGSAWAHGDMKGYNIQIASGVAVSGRLVLREFTDEDAKKEEEEKKSVKYRKK